MPQVIPFGYYYSRANCVVQVDGMRINWTFFGYTPAAAVPGEKGEIKTIDRTIQALNSLNPPLPERQAYEMAVRAAAEFAYPVVTDSCNRVK